NMMLLKVWFAKVPQPKVFAIGGEFLPGKGAKKKVKTETGEVEEPANELKVVRIDSNHEVTSEMASSEIVRVEQVFDVRTVPIKRIDALVFGHPRALDARSAGAQLVQPK